MPDKSKGKSMKGSNLDRDIQRLRDQIEKLTPYFSEKSDRPLDEFDGATEQLLAEIFGSSSDMIEAYAYAELGEIGSRINLPEEAQEGGAHDTARESLQQRKRVLESCLVELETRRAATSKKPTPRKVHDGPVVAEYMADTIRSVPLESTLRDAAQEMQTWRIGSLLVKDGSEYIGLVTETELSREVAARGIDPTTTTVRTCMREPLLTIESSAPIVEAVKLMKNHAARHLAVADNGEIRGVVSVSDILRYYSGIV